MAGQALLGFDGVLGHCVNMHPLRLHLDGSKTSSEFVRQVQNAVLDMQEHGSYTFGALLPKLKLPRRADRNPLFAVQFNFEQAREDFSFGDLDVSVENVQRAFHMYELAFNLSECKGEIQLVCWHDEGRYSRESVERWLRHYEVLLNAIVAKPEQRVDELPLLTEAERHQLLVEWSGTASAYPREKCVHELFEAQVARTPDTVAVEYKGRQLTYAELMPGPTKSPIIWRVTKSGPM